MPLFHQRVYEVARAIAPGRTLTCGEVTAAGMKVPRTPFAATTSV